MIAAKFKNTPAGDIIRTIARHSKKRTQNRIPASLVLSLLLITPTVRSADLETRDAAPPVSASPLSFNATLASQYVSRGVRQTWGKPALQAGADYADPSGFSVGTWMSTVSNRFVENATLEVDVYGGYSANHGDMGYSVIAYYYLYPGAEYTGTATSYNYAEIAAGVNYKYLYAKYYYTVSSHFFGLANARGTGYLDVGANIEIGSGYTLNLHAGDGRLNGTGNDIWNWRDLKIGLSKTLSAGWTAAGTITKAKGATNAYDAYTLGIPNSAGQVETSNPTKTTLSVALTKAF